MWRGRTSAWLVLALTALLGGAPAEAADRQSVSSSLTTEDPAASTGSRLSIEWRNPSDPSGKPYAVDTIVIHLAAGSRFDFSALPQCKASDAELMARGAAACPADSKVNSGEILSDTGSAAVFPRFIHTRAANFNNQGELVGVGDAEEIPFRSVVRSKVEGNTITIPVPDSPGSGPPDNFTAFKSLLTVEPALGRGVRVYARTPLTCPASGFWTSRYSFIYHDGVTQTEIVRSPCKRRGNPCLAERSSIGPRGIGRIRLRRTGAQLRRLPVRPPRFGRGELGWCVKGSRGRVEALFGADGRTEVVLTTAPGHGNRGVHPGGSVRRLRARYPHRRRLGRGLYRASPRGRQVIAVRNGRVRFLAVATSRLIARPAALRAALRRS